MPSDFESQFRCPNCGHATDLDGFDVGGADPGNLFCTQCSFEHPMWSSSVEPEVFASPEKAHLRIPLSPIDKPAQVAFKVLSLCRASHRAKNGGLMILPRLSSDSRLVLVQECYDEDILNDLKKQAVYL